jgi:hypothetical protein
MATVPVLDRRAFLTIAGGAVGLAALGSVLPSAVAAATTQTVWVLSTSATCRCSACRAHAANKVFVSAADALAGRAHVGCRCTPAPVQISPSAYAALFAGTAAGTVSADRRTPVVAAALAPVPASAGGGSAPVLIVAPSTPSSSGAPVAPDSSGGPVAPASADSSSGGRPSHRGSGRGTRAVDAARTDAVPSPSPTGIPQAVAASPVARLGAPSAGSALDWLAVPALAVVAGFGWLVWFRRRRDEDDPLVTEPPAS